MHFHCTGVWATDQIQVLERTRENKIDVFRSSGIGIWRGIARDRVKWRRIIGVAKVGTGLQNQKKKKKFMSFTAPMQAKMIYGENRSPHWNVYDRDGLPGNIVIN